MLRRRMIPPGLGSALLPFQQFFRPARLHRLADPSFELHRVRHAPPQLAQVVRCRSAGHDPHALLPQRPQRLPHAVMMRRVAAGLHGDRHQRHVCPGEHRHQRRTRGNHGSCAAAPPLTPTEQPSPNAPSRRQSPQGGRALIPVRPENPEWATAPAPATVHHEKRKSRVHKTILPCRKGQCCHSALSLSLSRKIPGMDESCQGASDWPHFAGYCAGHSPSTA
jgi:hypothetical protein